MLVFINYYTTVNYLKGRGVYVGLHLACSPKSCLLVYSYKRTSLADGISDRVPLVLHNFLPAKPCCIYRVESNEASDLGPYCTKTAVARISLQVPGFFASVLLSSDSNATLLV